MHDNRPMTKVFISYRRVDSLGDAGRIKDRLESRFGRGKVFFDISDIKGGAEFEKVIDASIQRASVLLVVVGPSWHQSFNRAMDTDAASTGPVNLRDYVKDEIKKGFDSSTPIVQILLKGVDRIEESRLPEELRRLAQLHALKLHHETFDADIERIIDAVREIERELRAKRWRALFDLFRLSRFWGDKSRTVASGEGKARWAALPVPIDLGKDARLDSGTARHTHAGSLWKAGEPSGITLIRLKDVYMSREFPGGRQEVLNGVSLVVFAAGFLAIGGSDVGARQALLNVISLREAPTSGTLSVGSWNVAQMTDEQKEAVRLSGVRYVARAPQILTRKVGVLSSRFGQERLLRSSIGDLLQHEVGRVRDFGHAERESLVGRAIARFRLQTVSRARLCDLDPQQFQRFFFAQAIVTNPCVLVVEAAAVMLGGMRSILDDLSSLNQDAGMTIVCEADEATKNVFLHAQFAAHLDDGSITKLGLQRNGAWSFVADR